MINDGAPRQNVQEFIALVEQQQRQLEDLEADLCDATNELRSKACTEEKLYQELGRLTSELENEKKDRGKLSKLACEYRTEIEYLQNKLTVTAIQVSILLIQSNAT